MKRVFSRLAAGLLDGLRGIGRFVAKLWKHPKGRIGLLIAGLLVILAVFAPLIAPYDPYDVTQRAEKGLSPPSPIRSAPLSPPGRIFSAC